MVNIMDEDLDGLSTDELTQEIRKLRDGIRKHRDSSGQDLCWHHPDLWGLLPERQDPLPTVPDWPQFLRGCVRYRESLDRELKDAPRTADEPSAAPGSVIGGIAPYFIVANLDAALAFYRDKLGFDVTFRGPDDDPFFGIVNRERVMIMLKDVGVPPLPNSGREAGARWDAYVYVPDPDALAGEFARRGVTFSAPLTDTDDGLRGFELTDVDGYVLFWGRPKP